MVSILLYADGMVLIAGSEHDLHCMIDNMNNWIREWRLRVNLRKTKIVHFRPKRKGRTRFEFKYNDSVIEIIDSYKYLGVYLDEHLDYNKCVSGLADSAGRALSGILSKITALRDCGYKTYTKLFDSGVVPILNY